MLLISIILLLLKYAFLHKVILYRLCHQVFAPDKAEYGYLVVLVKDAQGTKYLIQSGATGSDIVHYQNILVPNRSAKLFVLLCGKAKEVHYVWAEPALADILCYREIVLLMNQVKHLRDRLFDLILLCLRVSRSAILQYIVKILLLVCIHIKRDTGRKCLYQLHLSQYRLGKAVDIA